MLPGICARFGVPVWCYSAVVQRFSAKKNFFNARRFFSTDFLWRCGVKIYHIFSRNFLWRILPQIFTDFGHGFSQFFYGGGGIILGSMSEKIVGIFIINK